MGGLGYLRLEEGHSEVSTGVTVSPGGGPLGLNLQTLQGAASCCQSNHNAQQYNPQHLDFTGWTEPGRKKQRIYFYSRVLRVIRFFLKWEELLFHA